MIDQVAKILVDAGATPLSAVRAALVLEDGGTISAAWEEIEVAEVADFDAQLLVADLNRELERVLVRMRQ
jgi:hypothetical protein